MKPKVSVILPIYNVEKYLDRCVNSILNQTLKDIEVILVDDGSPDKAPQMCDEFAKKDCRVKVLHQKNKGAGLARNEGIKIANGEFYAFIDSDDYVELDMLEKMYNIALERKLDAVCCGISNLNPDGSLKFNQYCYPEYTELNSNDDCKKVVVETIRTKRKVINPKLTQSHRWAVWRFIFKASVFKEQNIQFLSERDVFSEDLSVNVQFLTHANRVGYLPDFMIYHCYNNESLTAQRSKITDYRRLTNQFVWLWEYCSDNNYPERINKAICDWAILKLLINTNLIAKSQMKYSDKVEKVRELVKSDKAMNLLKKIVTFKNRRLRHKAFVWAITHKMPRTALWISKV